MNSTNNIYARALEVSTPYRDHAVAVLIELLKVASGAKLNPIEIGYWDETTLAAILHDALEDEHITDSELRTTFGDNVYTLVHIVSREKQMETYREYIERVAVSSSGVLFRNALLVKRADLSVNYGRCAVDRASTATLLNRYIIAISIIDAAIAREFPNTSFNWSN